MTDKLDVASSKSHYSLSDVSKTGNQSVPARIAPGPIATTSRQYVITAAARPRLTSEARRIFIKRLQTVSSAIDCLDRCLIAKFSRLISIALRLRDPGREESFGDIMAFLWNLIGPRRSLRYSLPCLSLSPVHYYCFACAWKIKRRGL